MREDWGAEHYRWTNRETGKKLSWKETLIDMCSNYGSFCGRWHSNEFWKITVDKIPNMTEDECKAKVIDIEREADSSLAYWRAYQ